MTKTVVHVTTIEEWNYVLDVWFKQGYEWFSGGRGYASFFEKGGRYLFLGNSITWDRYTQDMYIEYSEFMAQQKEDNNMETYYVTREQLDLIVDLKKGNWPLARLVNSEDIFIPLNNGLEMVEEKAILRYLGGDETIDFKVKEQLYRLWRIDDADDKVYMRINSFGTPDSSIYKNKAFTAPIEEIKKWQTPAWEIEEAN